MASANIKATMDVDRIKAINNELAFNKTLSPSERAELIQALRELTARVRASEEIP
jgi:hypothetical protein